MSLTGYLVENYLTADSKPEKKSKKRKRREGLTIVDDENDTSAWKRHSTTHADEDGPVTGFYDAAPQASWHALTDSTVVQGASSSFRKARNSLWQVVGAPTPSSADQAAADAILASAAAESSARQNFHNTEDGPAVAESDNPSTVQKMESGAHAGLQSAADVAAQLARRKADERRRYAEIGDEARGKNQETIYRDASGRIINIAMQRAEMRKKVEEEAAKAQVQVEVQKGDVQRKEREQRREQLKQAKFMPLARHADDEQLNDELKDKGRWNDPAAGFLSKKRQGKSVTGRPLYQGPAAPNRYRISPGHRWDGVDRSNGFEKDWFAARNKRANIKELEYAWQMDE